MTTAILSIGDFSRATHMSVKMLRHYHQIGLLEPADINPHTGYRSYTADQIPSAQVIRRFRDLQMPLEQIRSVLEAPDPATRNALIATHLDALQASLAETQAVVSSLRNLLEGGPEDRTLAVTIRTLRRHRRPRSARRLTPRVSDYGCMVRSESYARASRPGGPDRRASRRDLRRRYLHKRTRTGDRFIPCAASSMPSGG